MLTDILIENFAIVERLELRLGEGLNVLTGETGAGKSIVIDAISYVLGARGGTSLIRNGARLARVEASFCDVPPPLLAQLDEWNIPLDRNDRNDRGDHGDGRADGDDEADRDGGDGGMVVLARETTASGRNSYRINGSMVTQAMLKTARDLLVEIHGQHDTFALLSAARHLDLLDAIGGTPMAEQRAGVYDGWKKWKSLLDERANLQQAARERERRREWLTFEAEEIEAMSLIETPDELETLQAERSVLANADKIRSRAEEAVVLLDGGDDTQGARGGDGVRAALGRVARLLGQVETMDAAASGIALSASTAAVAIEELRRDVAHYAERVDADPMRLEEVNERLNNIQRLQKKYGPTVADILTYARRARVELEGLDRSEARTIELDADVEICRQELGRLAARLSAMRRETADLLERHVAQELRELEMPDTRFAVRFDLDDDAHGVDIPELAPGPIRINGSGIDRVEFLLSANPGQPLQSLARVASGGEMSRVMLAMQSVLARVNPVGTMIFDEVDAGLGGVAAEAVAARLRKIAETPSDGSSDGQKPARRQVLCVTHLPLVAAAASVHWNLSKHVDDGNTTARARALLGSERAREIARMLAGTQASETTLRQAEEMLRHRASTACTGGGGSGPTASVSLNRGSVPNRRSLKKPQKLGSR